MNCYHVASDQPRQILGRHEGDCWTLNNGEGPCRGCQRCTEPHCRICGRAHADGSCAECLAAVRESLHEIGRMCDALPEEVAHRGINGEAMMLLGPAADPEARGHLEASVLAGRVPADYVDEADGELHPLFVLGSWDSVWRDALEHDEPTTRLTIESAINYLDRQMTYMAAFEHVPFEDFAKDLRRCSTHLESVLHDGEQVDRGAPCMKCRTPLERTWGTEGRPDGWKCVRCKQSSTEQQYILAVRADYEDQREQMAYLPMADCIEVTGAKRGAITGWASKGKVRKRREFERVAYCVQDIRDAQAKLPLAERALPL